MMVFLLFNEDVNFRGRKRVQLDTQQSLIRSPVEVHGGFVRATLEIPPGRTRDLEIRLRRSSCVLFVNFGGLRSESLDIRWVSTGIRVSVNSAPAGCLPVLSQLASSRLERPGY